jgi:hypothetical protein
MVAYYWLLENHHLNPCIYCHPQFNTMNQSQGLRIINSFSQLRDHENISIAIFLFPSLKNFWDILRLRLHYKARIIYLLHEPFESLHSFIKAGFSLVQTFRIFLIHLVNYLLVLMSDRIILPSSRALEAYKQYYTHLRKEFILMPLLFEDEAKVVSPKIDRKYISYIGTIAKDHAFDQFTAFVTQALDANWFPDCTFLVATRSPLPERERRMLTPHIHSGRVVIQEGMPMTNDTINAFFSTSLVIWNAYRRSMQSGILPKAYMFGTPVLVSPMNASEFFEDHRHGIQIEQDYDPGATRAAVNEILDNFNDYSFQCREKFISTFHHINIDQNFLNFIHI